MKAANVLRAGYLAFLLSGDPKHLIQAREHCELIETWWHKHHDINYVKAGFYITKNRSWTVTSPLCDVRN